MSMRGGDGVPWRRFFWDFLLFQAGGIAPLVALARDGSDGQMKKNATDALWNLALNADNKVKIARAGDIAPLVALARGGSDGQKESAAGAL